MNEEIEKLLSAMTNIEARLGQLSTVEETAKVKAELAELSKKQLGLAEEIRRLKQQQPGGSDNVSAPLTLGARVVADAGFLEFAAGKGKGFSVTLADPSPVGTGSTVDSKVYPDQRVQGIIGIGTAPLTFEDTIHHSPTSNKAIVYSREKKYVNNAAEVVNGVDSVPQSEIEFDTQTANVKDIGNCFIVTKDLMEDSQALADYINFRVQYGVKQRVESQLLNGDGTNANLSGLLVTGNYTPHGFDPDTNPEITNQVDLIGFAALAVKSVGLTPNVTIMNPVDYFKLRCLKDSNGRYLFSDPMAPSNRPIWDTYVVESSAMPKGKFLTLDTNMACMIYDRKETVVEFGYEDGNNFRKGLVTIKADRRLAFAIERPSGIVGGDLTVTKPKAEGGESDKGTQGGQGGAG